MHEKLVLQSVLEAPAGNDVIILLLLLRNAVTRKINKEIFANHITVSGMVFTRYFFLYRGSPISLLPCTVHNLHISQQRSRFVRSRKQLQTMRQGTWLANSKPHLYIRSMQVQITQVDCVCQADKQQMLNLPK